jgi:hypothetical protein
MFAWALVKCTELFLYDSRVFCFFSYLEIDSIFMKTFLVLFAATACLSMSHFVVNQIDEDTLLKKLQTALPESWQMQMIGDTLKLEHPDPIWVLKSNYFNAPIDAFENSEENATTILTAGIKTKAHIHFLVKPKKGLLKSETEKVNYYSQRYALFQLSAEGFDTPYSRCYPWFIEDQASVLYNVTLRENLKMVVGPVYPEVDYSRP